MLDNEQHVSTPAPTLVEALLAQAWEGAALRDQGPVSSYRLQLHPQHLRFEDAARVAGYLSALGVSHLYASPHLRCRGGSPHGYDVVDHQSCNAELGTEDELTNLHGRLEHLGMGMLLDWVPNHMSTAAANTQWTDVLENGPSSRYAPFFDVDWRPIRSDLADRILLPILGDQYGHVLERGELRLSFEKGVFHLHYWEHALPVSPRSYALILNHDVEGLSSRIGADSEPHGELLSILTALRNLPGETESEDSRRQERHREKEVIKRRLATLCESSEAVRSHVEAQVVRLNGQAGNPTSFVPLHRVLEAQCYRLAHWRVAAEEINYRRFFDINELVAIRMEDPDVFKHTHQLLFSWIERGWIRALRIDHPDGLFDPRDYFVRLQSEALILECKGLVGRMPEGSRPSWDSVEGPLRELATRQVAAPERPGPLPLYIAVEKILGRREKLPESWAVSGTTGYDFLNQVNGLFVDPEGRESLTRFYHRLTHQTLDFSELVHRCKRQVLESALASEVQVLAQRLQRIADSDWRTRDFTLGTLTDALREVIACFPVYRTYIPREGDMDPRDWIYVEKAVMDARRRSPNISGTVFEFLRDVLLCRHPAWASPELIAARREFVGKFQQITPPVMAKGTEDTAFYISHHLCSLNEVGGEPDRPCLTVAEFHDANADRLSRAPESMLSTATHDTKRGEDVRLRIDVLSELPDEWKRLVRGWMRLHRRFRVLVQGRWAPDRNDEYLVYQTLIGAWPGGPPENGRLESFRGRLDGYLQKAAREAKVHTSWLNSDPAYEAALSNLARGILAQSPSGAFWQSFLDFHGRVTWAAQQYSLSQVLLKIISPGVSDFYQGCELWDLNLVDPDNRRPVSFTDLSASLDSLAHRAAVEDNATLAADLANHPADGLVKLYVTWRSLHLRRRWRELFLRGAYHPVESTGLLGGHVVAAARLRAGYPAVLAVGGRHFSRMVTGGDRPPGGMMVGPRWWKGTHLIVPESLPPGLYRDVLTDRFHKPREIAGRTRCLEVSDLFAHLPVALLEAVDA